MPLVASPVAFTPVLVAVVIPCAVMGNIDIIVPTFLHEIDRVTTRLVAVAMLVPVLRMAGRHVQVDRLRGHTHWDRLDHDGLGGEDRRGCQGADVNVAIEAWLTNADRHASGGTHRQSGDEDDRKQETLHVEPPFHYCITRPHIRLMTRAVYWLPAVQRSASAAPGSESDVLLSSSRRYSISCYDPLRPRSPHSVSVDFGRTLDFYVKIFSGDTQTL